jgi:ribosomal protein L10
MLLQLSEHKILFSGKLIVNILFSMSKNLAQKKELKNNLNNEFVLFVQYYDYTTSELAQLKTNVKKHNFVFKVVKSSQLQKLLESTQYSALKTTFNGPIAVIYSNFDSSVVNIQECIKFIKRQDKIEIIGAVYKERILFPSMVNKFTELPSQKELLADSVGFLRGVSGQNVVQLSNGILNLPGYLLENIPNRLASILNQKANQA